MKNLIFTFVCAIMSNGAIFSQELHDAYTAEIMGVPVDIENKKDRCVVTIGGIKPLVEDLKIPPDCFFAKESNNHNKSRVTKQSDDIQSLVIISLEKSPRSKLGVLILKTRSNSLLKKSSLNIAIHRNPSQTPVVDPWYLDSVNST